MSLQRAKAAAFLTMLKLNHAKGDRATARHNARAKRDIAQDRTRVVLDAIEDRSDPGYVELAAEAWDAHQDLVTAKAEVEGLTHAAHQRFNEHRAAFEALCEIQRAEETFG